MSENWTHSCCTTSVSPSSESRTERRVSCRLCLRNGDELDLSINVFSFPKGRAAPSNCKIFKYFSVNLIHLDSTQHLWLRHGPSGLQTYALLVRNSLQDYETFPHDHCMEILKPSTLMHIGEKLLQLAATNNTDGGHLNTRFFSHTSILVEGDRTQALYFY